MTRNSWWRFVVAALLPLTIVAASCGKDTTSTGDSSTTTAKAAAAAAFIDPTKDCKGTYEPTKGITGSEILVGTVRPTSGPYAIYDTVTKGIEKYFDSVNAKGGVKAGDGKTYTIKLAKGDDGYDPANTPGVVKGLVENDGIFAMVGQIGTETNLAVREYMNQKCVPSIALATGSPEWGDNNKSPWYIGGLPSYAAEAVAFMTYLKEQKPGATIAVLYQNDDYGKSYLAAIKKFIAADAKDMKVVAEQPYDPASGQTTEAVTAQLAASKADVFFLGIGGTQCSKTLTFIPADWTPMTYASITCSGKLSLSLAGGKDEGVYTAQATLDAGAASDQANPKVQQFIADGKAVGLTDAELQGGIVAAGWGFAAQFVEGLELTKKVTRADLMNALWHMDKVNYGLMRDDAQASTDNAKDPWALEGLRIVQRKSNDWVEVAPLKDFDGKSNDLAG